MASRSPYESQLSRPAAQFVITLPRRQQKLVQDLADQIARQPFGMGDYQTLDLSGRTVENVVLDAYVFTYWVDHAVREVRITEIVRTQMVLGGAVSAYASPEDVDGFARAVEFSTDAMVDAYLAGYERVVVANHTQVKLEV